MDYDFSFLLALASLLSGLVWGSYALYRRLIPVEAGEFPERQEPMLVEFARSFFPIVFIVLILRSFLVEPFRIPSGSMMPTLLIGDFILVNKYSYGIRLPVLNEKIIEVGEPKRGDIVVFRFPKNPKVDFIKRVVGLPGDKISYYDKQIYLNGEKLQMTSLGRYREEGQIQNARGAIRMVEDLSGAEHNILVMPGRTDPRAEVDVTVPEGHYFVMGDNRDNSHDSRYWGFVPEANLVGRAFFIWMNLEWGWVYLRADFSRVGTILK